MHVLHVAVFHENPHPEEPPPLPLPLPPPPLAVPPPPVHADSHCVEHEKYEL